MKKKGLVTFFTVALAGASLGGCAALISSLRSGYTIQNNGVSVPKYTKKCTVTKSAKGDYELKISQYAAGEEFPSKVPHQGDWNNDGKFDWEMVAEWGDRNKDGKIDFVKRKLIERIGGNAIKSNIMLVDDNFDGYIDRRLVDVTNKKGKNNPDGMYDYEDIISRLYGSNKSRSKSKNMNIDYWINDLLPLYLGDLDN